MEFSMETWSFGSFESFSSKCPSNVQAKLPFPSPKFLQHLGWELRRLVHLAWILVPTWKINLCQGGRLYDSNKSIQFNSNKDFQQ